MKEIIVFSLSFFGVNFLAFLPYWVIGKFSKIDYPKKSFFNDSPYFILKKIVYQRFSDDSFRLIFEIQLLTLFLLLFGNDISSPFKWIFLSVFMISFAYITYITIILKVFKKEPMLTSDFNFAQTGLMIYKKKVPMVILGLLTTLICIFLAGNSLIEILIKSSLQIEHTQILILILLFSILISFFTMKRLNYTIYHSSVSFSLINHFVNNLKKCNKLKNALKTLNSHLPYDGINNIKFKNKPNIILVFLESYGSFAFSDNRYGTDIKKKMLKINEAITAKDYKSVSTFSESPVSSGGSWLSHSSVFYGAKVKDIAAHEVIFNETKYISKQTSLPKFLSSKGYYSTITSTLSYDKTEINWEKVKNNYPFDNMMLFNDFNYKGDSITIFGDRYTLPDEYSLNYAYNSLLNKSPFFLTVNTSNSHSNYNSPIKPLNDWKDYNSEKFQLTDGLKKNNLKNYFAAINYQLDYLLNFFLNNKLDNTITILIGDHQPPFITPENIDKATPIHIISKDNDFINTFKTFNFTEGLVPEQQTQKHESFFSKFIYALNKTYGEDTELDLPIFEDGINLY